MGVNKRDGIMNISKEQIEIITKYVPDVAKLVKEDDVQVLLDAIDDVIVNNILGHNNEPDATGIMLQRIWDQIYNQN